MPGAVASFILPVINAIGLTGGAASAVANAIGYAVTSAALYGIQSALAPSLRGGVPKAEDGKVNFRQSIPSAPYVLGRVRKGGDYVFFEEKQGVAYHIIVIASHRVASFVTHWLHDEPVTLDGDGEVTAPEHFVLSLGDSAVRIQTRLGMDGGQAYAAPVSAFGSIWTNQHRGDGLASVMLTCRTVRQEDYLKVYPNQMPDHTVEVRGALLFDPRDESTQYSENIALMRLWHLTHPVGGKLSIDDMALDEWAAAADVCDELVKDRTGNDVRRYHGGIWFRAEDDPVEVGRLLDQAGELLVYERADGKVGVHAGEFVEPDIRLEADDIIAVKLQANRSMANTVIAVRGEYTDPNGGKFVSAEASPYGDPYAEQDTERTRTVKNQVVQAHNHMARLQALTYKRANAPRVTIVAHYHAAKNVPWRRFVRVHFPPRLTQAVVELTGRPKVSLGNLTVEFQGILVPDDLYEFDAAVEEGTAGQFGEPVVPEGIPVPTSFDVAIGTEIISGGATAAFALGTWDHVDDSFTHEMEWQLTSGGQVRSVFSEAGEDEVRSQYLADGAEYRLRVRAWSGGRSSDWTSYVVRTATADPVAPGVATDVVGTGGAGEFTFAWTAPNSGNYLAARLWLGVTDTFGAATLVATEYGAANDPESVTVGGLAADDYYGWIEAINASGVGASPVATGMKTVT